MRMAMVEAVHGALLVGGVLTLYLGGVLLKIDRKIEEFYIEVTPLDFDRQALRVISGVAEDLGYEAMPEWECPPEEMPSGAVRHWLAEKEVLHDSRRALEAV